MPVCLTQCCANSVLNKHIKDSLCEMEKIKRQSNCRGKTYLLKFYMAKEKLLHLNSRKTLKNNENIAGVSCGNNDVWYLCDHPMATDIMQHLQEVNCWFLGVTAMCYLKELENVE